MIILVATQRSGTNILRRVLDTHERIHSVPEVFDDSFLGRAQMPKGAPFFLEYLLEEVTKVPSRALPRERPGLVLEYLKILETAVADSVAIVDVKYNSLHHAASLWWRPHQPPHMLSIFRQRNYRVVHLTRRNHLATALSELRASRTGVFAVPVSKAVEPEKMVVDPNGVLRKIEEIRQAVSMVRHWLRESGLSVLEVSYEDLFVDTPGSELDPAEFRRIADFVGVSGDGFDLTPTTRKIASLDLKEDVENVDELISALAGTGYEDCLTGACNKASN